MTFEQQERDVPIFILGITERCGTNFLFHLLCLHPEIDPGGPIWENYITLHLDKLVAFADAVYKEWNMEWKVPEVLGGPERLLQDLGGGAIRFLNRQRQQSAQPQAALSGNPGAHAGLRRLLTKNPSVRNLQHFFRIFPDAPLIILIRDGRSVVESAVKTFKVTYEEAIRKWTVAGEKILRFLDEPATRKSRVLLVKYEDIFQNNEAELRRIFAFLKLSPDAYDFSAAQNIPVVGSSELHATQKGVHWGGVEKKKGFDPLRRWENWTPEQQDRFEWLAGRVSERLGYPVSPASRSLWRQIRNLVLDRCWRFRARGRKGSH